MFSTFNFESTLKTIGSYAFSGCTGLSAIELSGNVKTIEDYAFSECTRLSSVEYRGAGDPGPSSTNTFNKCDKLEYVLVPKNYKSKKFCGKDIKKSSRLASGSELESATMNFNSILPITLSAMVMVMVFLA